VLRELDTLELELLEFELLELELLELLGELDALLRELLLELELRA
jgi:hypothetical protein